MSVIPATSLTNLAASGIALFQQDARLLTLRFAESSGLGDDTLLPHRLRGEEALSQSYYNRLDCLSADMHLEFKDCRQCLFRYCWRLASGQFDDQRQADATCEMAGPALVGAQLITPYISRGSPC